MAREHLLGRLQWWWASLVRRCPLVGWVTYPPLWVTLLAVVLVVAGLGQSLGIPSLVWHDRWWVQLLAGLSLTVLCLHLGVVGLLLDSRDSGDTDEPEVGDVARYVVWPALVLLLACGIGLARQHDVAGYGLCVMVAPLGWSILMIAVRDSTRKVSSLVPASLLTRSLALLERQRARIEWTGRQASIPLEAHALQALWMALLAVSYVGVRVLFWLVPAVAPAVVAVALALALATGVWGLFSFWMRRYRAIGLALVVLTVFVLGITRDVPPHGVEQVSLGAPCDVKEPCLVEDADALATWRQRLGRPGPLVVVTTSGGASRAAMWTITVLDALGKKIPGFLRHVRIVTGASGGMVGAAHYVSAMKETGDPPLDEVREGAAADSLSAVAGALILPVMDRGRALERAWEASSKQRMAVPFVSLAEGERAGWRPSLIFSPMMVEDGRRLIISNLRLPRITETLTPAGMCVEDDSDCKPSISAVELLACGCANLKALPLSTVARMNATFPWVTSAALLPSQPARRVVDAGYYDNYGVNVAALWIRSNVQWLKENTSGVLVIQIRDSSSVKDRRKVGAAEGPGYFKEWISALSTPIEGFLKAREASMSFRNDDEIGLLAADPRLDVGHGFFKTALFEFEGEAPLSWYLSQAHLKALSAEPDRDTLDHVARWWGARSR